jgi:uncharacterized membrane protein YsdA (DUF1294 family)/cold shock CspA family protein
MYHKEKINSEIGKIASWNDEKGFGFIAPDSGGKSIFLHINDFSKKHRRPMQGLSVVYTVSKDSKGRFCATDVYPEKGHKEVSRADIQKISSIFISSTFSCIVIGLVLLGKLPLIVLIFYAVVSVVTFCLYAKDKSAAQSGKWRTTEKTLHLFSLLGGWPGAAIAQSHLRHKSTKFSFRIVYWLTVTINCCIFGWLLTPQGTHLLWILLRTIRRISLS